MGRNTQASARILARANPHKLRARTHTYANARTRARARTHPRKHMHAMPTHSNYQAGEHVGGAGGAGGVCRAGDTISRPGGAVEARQTCHCCLPYRPEEARLGLRRPQNSHCQWVRARILCRDLGTFDDVCLKRHGCLDSLGERGHAHSLLTVSSCVCTQMVRQRLSSHGYEGDQPNLIYLFIFL